MINHFMSSENNPSKPVHTMCDDFITKEKVADKCLGFIFHQDRLAESVVATISEGAGGVHPCQDECGDGGYDQSGGFGEC